MFDPEDYYTYSKLGIAYAGLGINQKAMESGRKALELIDNDNEAIMVPFILYNVIQTYALIGDEEAGLNMINELLNRKSLFTLELIKLDPDMKYLLDDPGI